MLLSLTLVLQIVLCHTLTQSREQNVFQNAHLNHLQFSEGEVFTEMGIRSKVSCANLCSAHTSCKAFTFIPGGFCRAHDAVMTSASPATSATGAMTYSRRAGWLDSSCTGDQDCPVVSSTCFKGQCLCNPGGFYSTTARACVSTCSTADLQKELFVTYSNSLLVMATKDVVGEASDIPTLAACQRLCQDLQGRTCVGVVYRSQGRCQLWGPDLPIDWRHQIWTVKFKNSYLSMRMCR